MSSNNENRVLNRIGARELTQQEIDKITGAEMIIPTRLTVLVTGSASHPDETHDT